MSWKVPFFDLVLGDEEKQAVLNVIESNWLTAGPRIVDFESAFSAATGGEPQSVAVSSATAALHLSLLALGIGPGDEVIVPSLTFVACANVIRYVGATPVFADVTNELDWNISPADVAAKITPRTRAIIFFSNKNMTIGEGCMVISCNQKLVERLRILRSHGITASTYQRFRDHAYGYDAAELGYNYRLDEIRAAIGIEQLRKLSVFNTLLKERVERYRRLIAEMLPQVHIPFTKRTADSSFHIFPVLLPGNEEVRNNALHSMAQQGVQCIIDYSSIHTFSAYQGVSANGPVTNSIASLILTLLLFPSLSNAQMDNVIEELQVCIQSEE